MASGEDVGGTVYGGGRLGPREIRSKRFRSRRFGRPGFDAAEVRQFLARVAGEVAALRSELAGARDEGHRTRLALRDWQSWYAGARRQAESGTRDSRTIPPNRRSGTIVGDSPEALVYQAAELVGRAGRRGCR